MNTDRDEKAYRLLHAASVGDAAAVRSLLEQGVKADAPVSGGMTPLMEAAREGAAGGNAVQVYVLHAVR